jgi:DinB superfamily
VPMKLGEDFRTGLDAIHAELLALNPALAGKPWRSGGWTRKEIVGHLLDSATNNRQRFVRAASEGSYAGPQYAQDAWVAAHGYAAQSWETLLRWWQVEHEILAEVVDRVPEDRLQTVCRVGDEESVSLQFLIEDYLTHQRWHLAQLKTDPAAE